MVVERGCLCLYTELHPCLLLAVYTVKRSDVTGNRFEWELGENKVI